MAACRDKYHVLERFEVQVPEAQLELLDKLDGEWAKFQVRPSTGHCAALLCIRTTPACPAAFLKKDPVKHAMQCKGS